jgi:Uma2 family endonuclease
MALAVARSRITEEEFLRLPDDGRKYELVNGEVKEVPAGVRHDEYVARLCFLLYPFTRGKGALCGSQAGFRMANGNVRAPDVSFTRKERLPDGIAPQGFGDFAPDLCIEIISPSEDREEMAQKLREYFASGARMVWHMRPEMQTLQVFTSPTEFTTLTAEQEIDGGDLLPTFRCSITELFALE